MIEKIELQMDSYMPLNLVRGLVNKVTERVEVPGTHMSERVLGTSFKTYLTKVSPPSERCVKKWFCEASAIS